MASEMRVSCVLCASHACARGGVPPPPLPCVCSAVEPPLSILRGRSPGARGTRIVFLAHRRGDHTCRGVLPQGGTAWRGAERLGLSWLVRAARELPWVVDSTTTSTRHPGARSPRHLERQIYPQTVANPSAQRHSPAVPPNTGAAGLPADSVWLGCVAAPKNLIRTRAAYSSRVERRNKADS